MPFLQYQSNHHANVFEAIIAEVKIDIPDRFSERVADEELVVQVP